MKTMRLATLVVGCLSAFLAVPALAAAEAADDASDLAAKQDGADIVLPAPPEGKGQIVFYRKGGMGFALGCSVNKGGEKISSLGAGRYFIMVAEPGRHEFTVKSEAKDVLALEVEADETQYAECRIKMGIIVGRPDLRPSSEADFRKAKSLKMVDPDDMGPAPGALRPEEVAAAIAGPAETVEEAAPEAETDAMETASEESAQEEAAPDEAGDAEEAPADPVEEAADVGA